MAATLYGRLETSFVATGRSCRGVELRGVAEHEAHVRAIPDRGAKRRLERLVDLDGVNMPDAIGEECRQHAEAGADLEDDVLFLELRQPADHAQDVGIDEEVLAEGPLG